MTRRFRDFIQETLPLSMSKQKIKFEEELAYWQGEHEQTDDILVVGLEV